VKRVPRPAQLQKYWDEHPPDYGIKPWGYPEKGTLKEQMEWYVQKFQQGARRAQHRGDYKLWIECLRSAMLATVKAAEAPVALPAPGENDAMEGYTAHLAKMADEQERRNEAGRIARRHQRAMAEDN
jgi:hypothetical protein